MNLFYFVTIFSLLLAVLAVAEDTTSTTTSAAVASDVVEVEEGSLEAESRNLLIYRNLFKMKRKEHLAAVQKLLLDKNVAKRAKLIDIMMQTIVVTVKSATQKLKKFDLNSDEEDFPSDPDAKDALSQVLENTALFTDLIVRFPKVARNVYQKNRKSWKADMRKAIDVCHQNPVYQGDYQVLLHNLQQELGIGAIDETYKNPFESNEADEIELTSEQRQQFYAEAKRQKKMKANKKNRKSKTASVMSRSEL